jgi:hypothetical protein
VIDLEGCGMIVENHILEMLLQEIVMSCAVIDNLGTIAYSKARRIQNYIQDNGGRLLETLVQHVIAVPYCFYGLWISNKLLKLIFCMLKSIHFVLPL